MKILSLILALSIIFLLISLTFFKHKSQEITQQSSFKNNSLEGGSVSLKGKLEGFLETYKIGEFEYEEPLTGTMYKLFFKIDSAGNFTFSIDLPFKLITKAWFKIGKVRSNNFYIEANKKYQLSIKRKQITVLSEDGKFNNEIIQFNRALKETLGDEMKEAYTIKLLKVAYEDFINPKKEVEPKKLNFFQAYIKENSISEKAQKFILNSLKYQIAYSSLIHAKFYRRTDKNWQDYAKIPSKYPLEASDIFEGTTGLSYVDQLAIYLRNKNPNPEEKLAFFKSSNVFNQEELTLLEKNNQGENSEAYKQFQADEKYKIWETRHSLHHMLNQIKSFPASLGKDVLIAHGLKQTIFKKGLKPRSEELKILEEAIQNPSIFEYIKNYVPKKKKN